MRLGNILQPQLSLLYELRMGLAEPLHIAQHQCEQCLRTPSRSCLGLFAGRDCTTSIDGMHHSPEICTT